MRVLGWVLFAATCVLFALQGLFLAASTFPMTSYEVVVDHVFPLLGIGAIVGAGVGALIVSRYPRNLIGWLFVVGQLGNVIGLAAGAFYLLVIQGVVDSPVAAQVTGYLSDVFGTVFTVTVFSVIFMIAPDGRLLSRRWRLAAAVPVAAQVLWWAGIATRPPDVYLPVAAGETRSVRETLTEQAFILAGFFGMLLAISLGAVALVLRMRRSTGLHRLQLRWISTGAAGLAVTFVLFALSDLFPWGTPWILPVATCLAYIFFSVSVWVAIFRYRLYDIDVILRRATALGVLAVFVTVGYIVVVVAIGSVLLALGEPGSTLYWPSLVATALVAVAFQPVRRYVLRLADQLVYGDRAAPYEALASMSGQLADSTSPDAMPSKVAEATGRAVGAAHILVQLGPPGEPARSAAWSNTGSASGSMRVGAHALKLSVLDMGDQVGSIDVTMPPGRALRTFEQRLLEDVAAHAGVAFRNAVLEAELAARVEQGKAQSADLAASRGRLLRVEDEARERMAGAIRSRVVPHLAAVDSALTAIPAAVPPGGLEPLIDEAQQALDELRTLCRGVFPQLLDRRGLVPALSAQFELDHQHTVLDLDDTVARRLNRAVEAAGYLFCVEVAPTHRGSVVKLRVDDDQLVAAVTGDIDWANELGQTDGTARSVAWQHSLDRVAALDGAVKVQRTDSAFTVSAVIPLAPKVLAGSAAQSTASRLDLHTT